jgi:hypothetical protein
MRTSSGESPRGVPDHIALDAEWARKEGRRVCENEIFQCSFFQAVTDAPEIAGLERENL